MVTTRSFHIPALDRPEAKQAAQQPVEAPARKLARSVEWIEGRQAVTIGEPPICWYCRHRVKGTWTCAAFPAGIPDLLADGDFDHRAEFQGDEGIRFDPRSDMEIPAQFLGRGPRFGFTGEGTRPQRDGAEVDTSPPPL